METAIGWIFCLAILIFSIVLHEVAHGWIALKFGDDSALFAGRLTLNPIPHLDLLGSVILPVLALSFGFPIIAWAKPVPVNFDRLSPQRLGTICVSLAGIAVNFGLAVIAGLLFRLEIVLPSTFFGTLLFWVVYANLFLGVFNLLPIPPLDGWRLWGIWIPDDLRLRIEYNAVLFLFLFILILPYLPTLRLVKYLFTVITGLPL